MVDVPACAFDHVVMNLPASAVEFLDAFTGAFAHTLWAGRPLPLVHCYSFLRDGETANDLRTRAETALGGAIGADWLVVVDRDVAPHKQMVCASFRAPEWLRGGTGNPKKRLQETGEKLETEKLPRQESPSS